MVIAKSGSPSPFGVTPVKGGVNVAVFSQHATKVCFCLFQGGKEIQFELGAREGDIYFGFVPDVELGQSYGLRADGPYDPVQAQFFDVSKLLIDPYATRLDRAFTWHPDLASKGTETSHLVPRCIITAPEPIVKSLPPKAAHFIYEVAVKAFSKLNLEIPEERRGTVAALAHPASVAHFKRIGADTIELMPLMAWADERHLANQGLSNAWGYNPISFFAPDPRLAPGGLQEIRETIATLHDAGFRVVLDVVYNHTGESDLGGPTVSLCGLDNSVYYSHVNGVPVNDTGCGNTLAANVAPVTRLILDSMRHWVKATGLDGFRYDLAPIMGRGPLGFNAHAPLLEAIQQDPLLGSLIHIAEPWDIGLGGYQLGNFPSAWGEWNDRYRDDVRHFWRGDQGALAGFATRLAGSSDIFVNRKPSNSINFVAAHDGFTLRDFVTHDHKDNFANGEGNRDGNSSEPSWI
jgi:glycogen debranching enzyme